MKWLKAIEAIAPTVATALGGPLAGAAVSALGSLFNISEPNQEKIKNFIESSQMTSDHIYRLKELELKYQADEKERGFKYAELMFKDRDSARQANVAGGTQKMLFALSLLLLAVSLGAEVFVLFKGYPNDVPDIVIGRILGLLDAVAMLVLTYWYGTTNGSLVKTDLLSRSDAVK